MATANGMDSALWVSRLARVRGSLLYLSQRIVRSFRVLLERSEEWVVELVTPACNANQQAPSGQSAEVLALEFVIEFMDRSFLLV